MKYVMQETAKSRCGYCYSPVHLLIEEEPNLFLFITLPMFYICFHCKKVFQTGIGEVERVKDEKSE